MTPLRSVALVLCLAFLAAGCRTWDIYRPDLQRIANGERFVQVHGSIDPLPSVIDLHEDEAITLRDQNGREIRTTLVGKVTPKDLQKAASAQVTRSDENRVGIIVGSILFIGAGAAAAFFITTQ